MSAVPPPLAELCRRTGIELGFWDVRGTWYDADPEALCAVLRARGHQLDAPAQAEAALAAHDRASWSELAAPVAVTYGDDAARLRLRVGEGGGTVRLVIRREDGEVVTRDHDLEALPATFAAEVD